MLIIFTNVEITHHTDHPHTKSHRSHVFHEPNTTCIQDIKLICISWIPHNMFKIHGPHVFHRLNTTCTQYTQMTCILWTHYNENYGNNYKDQDNSISVPVFGFFFGDCFFSQ